MNNALISYNLQDVDILVLPARKRVSPTTSLESCVDDLQHFDEVSLSTPTLLVPTRWGMEQFVALYYVDGRSQVRLPASSGISLLTYPVVGI